MSTILPRRIRAAVLAVLVALLAMPASAEPNSFPEADEQPATGDWIVEMRPGWAQFNSFTGVSNFLGDASQERIGSSGRTYVASFDGETQASDAIARLASHPAVEYVEPDIIYEYQNEFVPNDQNFASQEWAQTVNLPGAWAVSSGNSDVVVAIVDSGIRANHPDLQGKVVEGRNFVDDGQGEFDATDTVGHGTAVAGIVAATGNNSIGIAGTAMNVQLMPIRVGTDTGAPVSRIALGVEYAVDNGAKVINLSLGSTTQSQTLERKLEYAELNDVIVVAATGNNPDEVSFPGSSPSTISIGATVLDGSQMANFSSRISVTDLVAPGVDVLSTYWTPEHGNTYAYVRGTSFATPIVTGTAALIHSVNPDLDVHQVRAILRSTAQMTFAEGTPGTGAGLLDASEALRLATLSYYGATWLPADEPVISQQTQRSWLWGPHAFDMRTEPYADAENGLRLVAYYDKSRMEITDFYGDRSSRWFVTNGLLVNELITGQMQVGDNQFEARDPAQVPVAGDPEANGGPTYASFASILDDEPTASDATITQTLDQQGTVGENSELASYGVTAAEYIPETNRRIASVFWEYLLSNGVLRQSGQYLEGRIFDPTFFATGFPVTNAYWSTVTVAGEPQDVLIQCFERRCLTYTPGNEPAWQVEIGNVGQHYYRWRYDLDPGEAIGLDPSSYAIENLR